MKKNLFCLLLVPGLLLPADFLVDGIHGWTSRMDVNLWTSFPSHEFTNLTVLDFPIDNILSQGAYHMDFDPIVIQVPQGSEVLYFRSECTNFQPEIYPYIAFEAPDGTIYDQLFSGHTYIENPMPGQWIIYYMPDSDVYLDYVTGTGPHYFTENALSEFDGLFIMLDNQTAFADGHTLPFSEFEQVQLVSYMESGGSVFLIREPELDLYSLSGLSELNSRSMDFLGFTFHDECQIVDENGGNAIAVHSPPDNEVAQTLFENVTTLLFSGASAVSVPNDENSFPVITAESQMECTPLYPPGSMPPIAVARTAGLGRFIGINDLHFLSDQQQNHTYLSNCLNWITAPPDSQGDVNQDGQIDVLDIVTMVNIVVGITQPSPWEQWAADLNGDGEINVLDVVLVVNIIIGT